MSRDFRVHLICEHSRPHFVRTAPGYVVKRPPDFFPKALPLIACGKPLVELAIQSFETVSSRASGSFGGSHGSREGPFASQELAEADEEGLAEGEDENGMDEQARLQRMARIRRNQSVVSTMGDAGQRGPGIPSALSVEMAGYEGGLNDDEGDDVDHAAAVRGILGEQPLYAYDKLLTRLVEGVQCQETQLPLMQPAILHAVLNLLEVPALAEGLMGGLRHHTRPDGIGQWLCKQHFDAQAQQLVEEAVLVEELVDAD